MSVSTRPQYASVMGHLSWDLQEILIKAGFVKKGGGVSSEGIKLVSRIAKEKALRDWAHTRHVDDYNSLIQAVREHLEEAA